MAEWFEDETLWRDLYPYMFPESRFAAAEEEMEQALLLANCQGGTALDLCCGPGRCALALARRGLAVTGVDRTRYLLDIARRRGEDAGIDVEWVEADMRDFVRPQAFDLVVNMFTSFGYFADEGDNLRVLEDVYRSLKPGGAFLLDVMGKERLARIFLSSSVDELSDGSMLVQRREVGADWTRIDNEWILIPAAGGEVKRFQLSHTVYSGQELRWRMLEAGFAAVSLYGSLAGAPYDREATRLIAVGHKTEP